MVNSLTPTHLVSGAVTYPLHSNQCLSLSDSNKSQWSQTEMAATVIEESQNHNEYRNDSTLLAETALGLSTEKTIESSRDYGSM